MVQEYIRAKSDLIRYFNCNDDYFIKTMTECNWMVREEEGVSLLTYWNEDGPRTDALIVRKDSKPLIYPVQDYTMVVAIDCIKIAFIMQNDNKK